MPTHKHFFLKREKLQQKGLTIFPYTRLRKTRGRFHCDFENPKTEEMLVKTKLISRLKDLEEKFDWMVLNQAIA